MLPIELKDLPLEGADFEGAETAEELDLPREEPGIRIVSAVQYNFHVQVTGDEFIATGRVGVDVEFDCSRCIEPFAVRIEDGDFVAIRDLEGESGPLFVDLTADIRESILLAFPSHPVCRPDCRGLCPQCGANRNNVSCRCGPPADGRWSGLDTLKHRS